MLAYWSLAFAVLTALIPLPAGAQADLTVKKLEKVIKSGSAPLFIDGERVYRVGEVTERAVVTYKPEPSFTEKAREKNTFGVVRMRVVLKASGEVKVVHVLKRLPHGLTEQALEAAAKIRFQPAMLDGKAVSQAALLEYNFNKY